MIIGFGFNAFVMLVFILIVYLYGKNILEWEESQKEHEEENPEGHQEGENQAEGDGGH